MTFKEQINLEKLPKHVAIIMDGNGRWAREKGFTRIIGHQNGVAPIKAVAEAATELGVKYITLYAFSTENWNRPKEEVDALMELLISTIKNETATLNKNNIRLMAIGDLKSLPPKSYLELNEAIKNTENNSRMNLVLALSYSSRWEILDAVKNIASEVKANKLSTEDIDQKLFSSFLTTKDIPDPELLIRTSGEYRISNFLLWQIAYTECILYSKIMA